MAAHDDNEIAPLRARLDELEGERNALTVNRRLSLTRNRRPRWITSRGVFAEFLGTFGHLGWSRFDVGLAERWSISETCSHFGGASSAATKASYCLALSENSRLERLRRWQQVRPPQDKPDSLDGSADAVELVRLPRANCHLGPRRRTHQRPDIFVAVRSLIQRRRRRLQRRGSPYIPLN